MICRMLTASLNENFFLSREAIIDVLSCASFSDETSLFFWDLGRVLVLDPVDDYFKQYL